MHKGKIIVASMILFCVLCIAAAAAWFLLIKSNHAELGNQQQVEAILKVAGLTSGKEEDEHEQNALFEKRIISRKVNLDSGELMPANTHQDVQSSCVNLAADKDPAQIRQRCNIADVFLVQNNEHDIQQVILPFSGKGAKSMLHAFIALETDGRTVKNLVFYDHNETPGLGAKVDDPQWLSQWPGKKVLDDDAQPVLKIVQDNPGSHDDYTVDGITGATMTSNGVEKSLHFWMGDRGYGHFLQRIAQNKKLLSD